MRNHSICYASLLLIVLSLALTGCVYLHGTISEGAPFVATENFRAGAHRLDITPLPGFGMGGHAIAGRVSRGFFGRLYARAIYLEDRKGRAVAVVSADLWSIPVCSLYSSGRAKVIFPR